MKKLALLGAGLALVLLSAQAQAQTVDDPLHGYTFVGGVPTNNDNGVDTPLNGTTNFGFFVSPGDQTGDLILAILTPNTDPALASISVSGTLSGSGSFVNKWTTGDLGGFLGYSSIQPPGVNKINNGVSPWPQLAGSNGYNVDTIDLGTQTLPDFSGSTMAETLSAVLPVDSVIVAFLLEGNTTVATANSGALFVNTDPVATPIPGSLALMTGGLTLLGFMVRRKRRPSPVSVLA